LAPFFSGLHVLGERAAERGAQGGFIMTKSITLAGLCLTMAVLGNAQNIVVFAVPNAVTTSPNGILATGEAIGNWIDSQQNWHGFIRRTNGGFTTFDVPGASSTIVSSFNPEGTISGRSVDTSGVSHGFLRSPGGAFTSFDLPGAGQGRGQGTFAQNINESGTIGGYYMDKDGVTHGFIGTPGNFTTFDAPGAITTFTGSVACLNPSGDLVGGFPDANHVNHAYVRTAKGVLTQIDVSAQSSTFVTGISPGGVISGFYFDPASPGTHGYLRNRLGQITTFDYPAAFVTVPENVSTSGRVTGFYADSNSVVHGLVGLPGNLTEFDAPGAGTGFRQGTFAVFNDPNNAVTGYVIDGQGVTRGFLRKP
jgi:hypothetical protein